MNRDVITGPGEYRMRNGSTWHCCAVVNGTAVGYTLNDDGEVTHTGCRYADSGLVSKGCECTLDILPPEPVITGPGPYIMRNGELMHVAVIKDGIAFGFYESDKDLLDSHWNAETGAFANSTSGFDVIRKRTNP